MHCPQKFLACLMLFTSAVYALATKDQADGGKVAGFTGPADVDPTGDYLTGTYCYCKYPEDIDKVMGLAHYYQFDYYNTHLNTTFILTSKCPQENLRDPMPCVPQSGGRYELAGDTMMGGTCRKWPGSQNVHLHEHYHEDKFCYKPLHHDGDDFIYFNKQKRNLGQMGSEGPVWQDQKESEKVCKGLCRERLNADLLTDDVNYTPSHQVTWTDLDSVSSIKTQ